MSLKYDVGPSDALNYSRVPLPYANTSIVLDSCRSADLARKKFLGYTIVHSSEHNSGFCARTHKKCYIFYESLMLQPLSWSCQFCILRRLIERIRHCACIKFRFLFFKLNLFPLFISAI